jgi:hypothetical protein
MKYSTEKNGSDAYASIHQLRVGHCLGANFRTQAREDAAKLAQ